MEDWGSNVASKLILKMTFFNLKKSAKSQDICR